MQAAKEAARNFLHRDHQHDTSVCETFKPAITKETVVPVEKLEETVAIDREVHQDHYQTRIQPVEDKVREAERHEHNVLPVEHREQRHGKDAEIKRKLEQEAQQFKSTTTVLPTTRDKVSAGTITGEHIHHHVHEKVQPVIEREIIQPTVIHTTVPIHERIEHEPTFHPATVQPKMTMEEFRKAGGVLDG
ncbi:allergen, partial [Wilcoxina mikolae CBS 423.85]